MRKPFDDMDSCDASDMNYIISIETPQAQVLGKALIGLTVPQSVIDIGCGPGNYLLPFVKNGCECLGIDGSADAGQCIANFQRVDLRFPWMPAHRYDLALCIEVAEHLPAEYADGLVDTIAACSDVVFFTAATPNQGGKFHHNERPHEYWRDKFAAKGYERHAGELDPQQMLYASSCCLSWFTRNAMLFQKAKTNGSD